MIRNLKALGLALVAVFAFSAMAASGASAVEAHFKIDNLNAGENGTITVEQDTTGKQLFVTDFGTVECETFMGHNGAAPETAATLTVTSVTYKGHQFAGSEKCKITKLNLQAEINFGNCDYTFNAGTWLGAGTATGNATIDCSAGVIQIVGAGCTITVPAQTPAGHIVYSNVPKTPTTADYVTAEATVTGIKYEGHGVLCATGLKTNGTYTGNAIATGFNQAGVEKDVTVTEKK